MTKEISPELKAKILEESRNPSCVISELANRYKIKVDQIYRWRRNDRSKKAVSAQPRANGSNFVEAKLEESDFEDRKNILIKKASLTRTMDKQIYGVLLKLVFTK